MVDRFLAALIPKWVARSVTEISVDELDNYQRNPYGTTPWATDYAGRNPVEGSGPSLDPTASSSAAKGGLRG